MKPTILAIRAIGTEFAKRTFRIVAIFIGATSALLLGLTIWLTTLSSWWLLLLFVLICALCIAISVLTVFWLTIRRVTPKQSPEQRKAVSRFVDNIQKISDIAGTPKIALLFQLVRDIAMPRETGFIGGLTTTTKELRDDLSSLITLFS